MKKILLIALILSLALPSQAFWPFGKKTDPSDVFKKEDAGYKGTLPDVNKFFQYKKESVKSPDAGNLDKAGPGGGNLVPAPIDDPLFMDYVVKKKKTTPFQDDLMLIVPVLEKFKACIENGADIQIFNANVNMLDLHARNLEKKYSAKPEAASKGYAVIQEVAYRAKLLGNLKYDANFYSKYSPNVEGPYSDTEIARQDGYMLQEIDRALGIITVF